MMDTGLIAFYGAFVIVFVAALLIFVPGGD